VIILLTFLNEGKVTLVHRQGGLRQGTGNNIFSAKSIYITIVKLF